MKNIVRKVIDSCLSDKANEELVRELSFSRDKEEMDNLCERASRNWCDLHGSSHMAMNGLKENVVNYFLRFAKAVCLWSELGDVPVDDGGVFIDEDFLHFPKGTEQLDVWHWFEAEFNISIGRDLIYI